MFKFFSTHQIQQVHEVLHAAALSAGLCPQAADVAGQNWPVLSRAVHSHAESWVKASSRVYKVLPKTFIFIWLWFNWLPSLLLACSSLIVPKLDCLYTHSASTLFISLFNPPTAIFYSLYSLFPIRLFFTHYLRSLSLSSFHSDSFSTTFHILSHWCAISHLTLPIASQFTHTQFTWNVILFSSLLHLP